MIGDNLAAYTFEYLLNYGLADLPDTVDKRVGSPVYDAVASEALLLEKGFEEMRRIYQDTFAQYSAGEPLQLRAEENGVSRYKASPAVRKGVFVGEDDRPCIVPIGSRFSTIDGENTVNFTVTDEMEPGTYKLECEVAGTAGNRYLGPLLPISVLNGLKSAAMTDIIVPGDDAEEDEHLRQRYFDEKNSKKFGGNIDQYRELMLEQDGVGACQIYPVWAGGGTVKISFVDSTLHAAGAEHVHLIQQAMDPVQDGQGIGLAPIDHAVTITTPDRKRIDVSAAVQAANGYSLDQLKPLIETEIETYFSEARKDWGEPMGKDNNDYALTIFRSQVIAAILRVIGVINVTDLLLNGSDSDVELQENAMVQELPELGVVTVV